MLRQQPGGWTLAGALFTRDFEVPNHAEEVASLQAIMASKVCDTEQVGDLLVYLSYPSNEANVDAPKRVREAWTP